MFIPVRMYILFYHLPLFVTSRIFSLFFISFRALCDRCHTGHRRAGVENNSGGAGSHTIYRE